MRLFSTFIFFSVVTIGVAQNLPSKNSFKNSLRGNGIMFTQNKGQVVDMKHQPCPDILFKANAGAMDLYLRKTGISYVLKSNGEMNNNTLSAPSDEIKWKLKAQAGQNVRMHRVDVDFVNANQNPEVISNNKVADYSNYYYPQCPEGITNVNSYGEIIEKNMYKNIDVKYYGSAPLTVEPEKSDGLKYDIIVNPGGNPDDILFKYSGADGISIKNGKLKIKNSLAGLTESLPSVYQVIDGKKVEVTASYILNENSVKLKFGKWKPEFALVIDPFVWATYYGGSSWADYGSAIATDGTGNSVITGSTASIDFPVLGAYQPAQGSAKSQNAFIVKFDPQGTRLWATYYGGSFGTFGTDIATDINNNVLITGFTFDNDFPVSGSCFQPANAGGLYSYDAIVVKFDSNGIRQWATYCGGTNDEKSFAIATDPSGNVTIHGMTISVDFPTTPTAFQPAISSTNYWDAFVIQFNYAGARQWATYYGGNASETAWGIATDVTGNIFISGGTSSTNFPVLNACQAAYKGLGDAYIAKFDPTGIPKWSTYYGGNNGDCAYGITTDKKGNLIVSGSTSSSNFPATPGAFQPTFAGTAGNFAQIDAFVAKFDNNGSPSWSTFLGGDSQEEIVDCTTDKYDNIYVIGDRFVDNGTFPMNTCGMQKTQTQGDFFLTKFKPDGHRVCSTFLGGTGYEQMNNGVAGLGGIATFGNDVFAIGINMSGGFPVTAGAFQKVNNSKSGFNPVIMKFCGISCGEENVPVFSGNQSGTCNNTIVSFNPSNSPNCDTNNFTYQWSFTGGNPSFSTLQNPSTTYLSQGSHNVKLVVSGFCGKDSVENAVTITPTYTVSISANDATCSANNGSATATIAPAGVYTYTWSSGGQTTATASGLGAGSYMVTVKDANGCTQATTVNISSSGGPVLSVTSSVSPNCVQSKDGSATVTATGTSSSYTYSWNTTASQSTSTATGLGAGVYVVTVYDSNNCSTTKSVTLTSPAQISFGPNTLSNAHCKAKDGSANIIVSGGSPNYTYSWDNNQTTQNISSLAAGKYMLTVTDSKNCTALFEADINTVGGPAAAVQSQTPAKCNGSGDGTASLQNPVGGVSPYTYTWSSGVTSTGLTAGALSANTYTIIINDAVNCSALVTVTISQPPAITSSINATNASCAGISNGSLTVNAANGVSPYTYTWNTLQTGAVITGLGAGNYSVTIYDKNNCSSVQYVQVGNDIGPTATAGGDATVESGTPVQLSVNSAKTYLWSPPANLNCDSCQDPIATPQVSTWYYVTITDANGCSSEDSVYLKVEVPCGTLFIPSAFSPNGDGMNDKFCVRGKCINNYLLRVFDRWGEQVFESMNITNCWDGTFKGKLMNTGVYVYLVKGISSYTNELIEKTGNVTLIR